MPLLSSLSGPVDTQYLGFTLMHEHIFVGTWSMRTAFPNWIDRRTLIDCALAELHAAHESGVRTIVDVTPINLGRDVALLREIAEGSDVRLVAATGLYWTEEPWLAGWEVERIFDWLLEDASKGWQGTGIKPGIIKCGTDWLGVTPLNEKLLRTTARLHRATGLPITTHTTVANHSALDQLDIFASEGVDMSRVVIGHCGDTEDFDMLESVLARGSYIGVDRFGSVHAFPTEKRVKVVAELCRRGHAKRMVLSHDGDVASDFGRRRRPRAQKPPVPTKVFCYIADVVLPALREAGVTAEQIDQMTVENPRRLFGQAT